MKREKMLEQLGYLKEFCESASKVDSEPETWREDVQALNMAISILGDEYLDDLAYIKDLINYIFIFLGIVVVFGIIIMCRL